MGGSRPRSRGTENERLAVIREWSDWFYERTNSYSPEVAGDLGMELAYLWAAIAHGTFFVVDNPKECEVVALLAGFRVPKSATIWKYIKSKGGRSLMIDYDDFPDLLAEVEKRK
jgi:hypothetical protein